MRMAWTTCIRLSPLLACIALFGAELSSPTDVAFTASIDNTQQRYVEMLPVDFKADETYHALIALHGHGSDRWQFVRDNRGECKGARDVAARHGFIFVSPDYRAKTSWMGPKAEADLLQIIGELKKKHKIAKVLLTGGSMGGTSALIFTALHPQLVDGAISLNGTANMEQYDNFLQYIAESYGGDKKAQPDEYRKRSPELFPERFTMPLAVTVGGKDTLVPPDSVLRLANAVSKKNTSVLIINRENTGHETSYADTVTALEFAIEKVLGTKPR
ncbi:MAG TPA: alpha/beta fold hydrolase [Planctomycetota bacterium]